MTGRLERIFLTICVSNLKPVADCLALLFRDASSSPLALLLSACSSCY